MPTKQFLLNPSRTAKQGTHINISKDSDEYIAMTTTVTMHEDDMAAIGVSAGESVLIKSEYGEASFKVEPGKTPEGMLFVPYGPPTCLLMGAVTDGTGMPMSKGWIVDVTPVSEA